MRMVEYVGLRVRAPALTFMRLTAPRTNDNPSRHDHDSISCSLQYTMIVPLQCIALVRSSYILQESGV